MASLLVSQFAGPIGPIGPVGPAGITKLILYPVGFIFILHYYYGFGVIVTEACVPGAPVVTVPIAKVGVKPVGPVGPVGPATVLAGPVGPVAPSNPCGPVGPVAPAGITKSKIYPVGFILSSFLINIINEFNKIYD